MSFIVTNKLDDLLFLTFSDGLVIRHVFEGEVKFAGEFVQAVELLDDIYITMGGVLEVHYWYYWSLFRNNITNRSYYNSIPAKNKIIFKSYTHEKPHKHTPSDYHHKPSSP